MPPAAGSSHLCWLPSRGVMNSMVTPSGASFLCQHPLGTTTRSPARRLRSISPSGPRTVRLVEPAPRTLVRRIPARFHSALQSMQDQGRRDSAGQATTAKLAVGLNLDLVFPPAYRRGASAGDKPALMQDAHA